MTNPFHIPSDPTPLPQSDNAEVHIGGGNTRVSTHGGVEVHSSDGGNGASGILGTARGSHQQPVGASALKPTDTVDIGGQRVTVKIAEKMGYLTRNANTGLFEEGNVVALNAPPAEADEEQHDDWDNPRQEPFAVPEVENFVSLIPQPVQVGIMNDMAETGTVSKHAIEQAAQRLGVEPAQAQEYLSAAVEAYAQQAGAVLSEYGISDPEDFARWAMKARPSGWKEALQRHQNGRTTVGYRPLALDYLAHVHDTDPRAIVEGVVGPGVSARVVGKTVYVKMPGVPGEMPFKAALKAGFAGRGRR